MGHHEVSDPFWKRGPATRDRVVTMHRLLDCSQLGVRESHVDSVLTRMRGFRSSTPSHRFSDITISENRSTSNSFLNTSPGSCFRRELMALRQATS
jgi:hypothetical protein